MKASPQSCRASVVLLALCFVAVLGISLASYLALASRSMALSNRAVKQGLAGQLAELGLEEGLRATNLNLFSAADTNAAQADWSAGGTTAAWTLDSTNKRARATLSFPSGKFGPGITATVKVRVDNYDAHSLDAIWSASANYRAGDIVGYSGLWYRSSTNQTNKTPSMTSGYWAQEQSLAATPTSGANTMIWQSGASYYLGSMINRNGSFYRCSAAHVAGTSNQPPNVSNWTAIPYVTFGSDLQYVNDSMVWWTNTTWYRYSGGSWIATAGSAEQPRWFHSTGTTYYNGDMVLSSGGTTWYRYINSTPSSGAALTNTTYWSPATTFTTAAAAYWNWDSSQTYNIGDVVYHSTTASWYRCRIANFNQAPSSTSVHWSNAPALSQEWDAIRQYSVNDVVRFNDVWYLSRTSTNNIAQNPATQTSYWYSAKLASQQWNATTTYAANAYRSYGGVWYRCLVGNTGFSPNHTTYWTPTWAQGSGATTGGPVIYAEATVSFADGTTSVTQYRAALNRSPLFPNALAATTTLTLSGSSTSIVSYESTTDPTAATEGYSAVVAAGTASASGTSGLLTISSSSTTIKGYLAAPAASTGYTPRVSYPANALLQQPGGSVTMPSPTAINVDLARISGSPYIPQFSVQSVPTYSSGVISNITAPTTVGTAGGATPMVLTRNGNLTLNNSSDVLIIVGPVVLNIQGDLQITGNSSARIVIAETGSLRIHISGRLRLDSTGGGIDNQTLDPKKCILLSTATSGDHNFSVPSTTRTFHGVIYMPNEDLAIDATTATIFGAVSARALSVTGSLNLRYDTSLRGADLGGVDRPWAVTEWRQLSGPTNLATMP